VKYLVLSITEYGREISHETYPVNEIWCGIWRVVASPVKKLFCHSWWAGYLLIIKLKIVEIVISGNPIRTRSRPEARELINRRVKWNSRRFTRVPIYPRHVEKGINTTAMQEDARALDSQDVSFLPSALGQRSIQRGNSNSLLER